MNDFFYLFVAELFVFASMWHNKSARSGMERESERPDPAVLFSRVRTSKQKASERYQSAPAVHSPQLPLTLGQVRRRAHDVYFSRGNLWGIVAKLRRALRIEIPIGYQDELGFHRIVERPPIKQQIKG
ncbi:MAG: hypothetical protein ABSF60_07770 [Verrucomicrobiota bacterium]|jgi:hypothetical protein